MSNPVGRTTSVALSDSVEWFAGMALIGVSAAAGILAVVTSLVVLVVVIVRPSARHDRLTRAATAVAVAIMSTIAAVSLALGGSWLMAAMFSASIVAAVTEIVKIARSPRHPIGSL